MKMTLAKTAGLFAFGLSLVTTSAFAQNQVSAKLLRGVSQGDILKQEDALRNFAARMAAEKPEIKGELLSACTFETTKIQIQQNPDAQKTLREILQKAKESSQLLAMNSSPTLFTILILLAIGESGALENFDQKEALTIVAAMMETVAGEFVKNNNVSQGIQSCKDFENSDALKLLTSSQYKETGAQILLMSMVAGAEAALK